jgi:hypothetical protein
MQDLWINAASTCSNEILAASNITARTLEYSKRGMTLQCVFVCHLTQFAVGIQEAPTAVLAPLQILKFSSTYAVLDASESFDNLGGTITMYQWHFISVSGTDHNLPSVPNISDPQSSVTRALGLFSGFTYQFQVIVEDNDYARDIAVQHVVVQRLKAHYSIKVSATSMLLSDELIVTVSIVDTHGIPISLEHDPCSVHVSYEDGSARQGEHFLGYSETLNFASNQSVVASTPVVPLFAEGDASKPGHSVNFTVKISNGTAAFPLDLSLLERNKSVFHIIINTEPITNLNQDVLSFSYTTYVEKDNLLPKLLKIKQGIADVLGLEREKVLLGRISQFANQRRASLVGSMIPVKVLSTPGSGHTILGHMRSAGFVAAMGSLIPQGLITGSLSEVVVSSR